MQIEMLTGQTMHWLVGSWTETVVRRRRIAAGIVDETVDVNREQVIFRAKRAGDLAAAEAGAQQELLTNPDATVDRLAKAAGKAVVLKQLSERPHKARTGARGAR